MGRVKIIAIKNLGDGLLSQNDGKFTDNFDTNKKVLADVKQIKSKKIRNILAGYITRKVKIKNRK